MYTKISEDMIHMISMFTKLELSEAQRLEARTNLENMLEQMEILKELDVDNVQPMTHPFLFHNVFGEDVIRNEDKKKAILQNAPEQQKGQFKVPKTME